MEIPIPVAAHQYFEVPRPFGIYGLLLKRAHWSVTSIGSVDLRTGAFIPEEYFDGNSFRLATSREKIVAGLHRFVAAYLPDVLIYLALIFIIDSSLCRVLNVCVIANFLEFWLTALKVHT